MIRKLLLLLVVITYLQNTSYAQGAEIYGNAFWQSAHNRICVRLALRNPTGSSTGQMNFVGMRFGIQFNNLKVQYAGFNSYMSGINASDYLSFIGPDTNPDPGSVGIESPSSRVATINTGGTKIMQRRFINLSTNLCANGVLIPSGTMAVLIDIYFTFVSPAQPSDYHLTSSNYGFGDPEFIAQFLHKNNGDHTGNLVDAYKEIAIVINRQGNSTNPYQPFDASNCTNSNFAPITLNSADINFLTPVNGVLTGKAVDAVVTDKTSHVLVQWKSENNQLIDYFEVQRKDNNGEFKTIGLVMSFEESDQYNYEFKDKVTVRDIESSYRIKVIDKDYLTSYSTIQKIRLGGSEVIQLKVYPNPSSNVVYINLPDQSGVYVCRMYSTQGKMLLTSNISSSNPSVNIQSLQAGSYFMELYHPKTGMRYYTQFSKQ